MDALGCDRFAMLVTYLRTMTRFEWDEAKNARNKSKHHIDFETAQMAFDDPFCVSFVERIDDGEERWQAIGMIEKVVLIVVVHTYQVRALPGPSILMK